LTSSPEPIPSPRRKRRQPFPTLPATVPCRPPYKTDHHDLRRTIEAIIWRHDNGAKWRRIPAELGPWWMAAQTFSRWLFAGIA